jgi:putative surface cell wall-binding protein
MRHRLFILGAFAALSLLGAAAAVAGTFTATANVSGTAGVSLSLPAGPSISVTLTGDDQVAAVVPVLGVVDARGNGAGWKLTIASTTFDDGGGHSFGAPSVSSVGQSCHSGSSCTAASPSGLTYPIALAGTATKVFNAAGNSGMGKLDLTPSIDIAVPGNAFAGTYTATVTLAAATGP